MNIKYQLTNTDFLAYQLYTSSKSKLHKKSRFLSQIIVPVINILIGLYLAYIDGNMLSGIVFFALAIIWFVVYPLYSKWRYKRHFQKHIKENYKNRINKPVEINLNQNSVNLKDVVSEGKINGTELKELIETKNHFFVKLTSDVSFIVPKASLEKQEEFKNRITKFGAEYVDELNWKWK